MKTVAIIQARMGSTRLPGKVLKDLNGASMLSRVATRTKRSSRLENVVVATSTLREDDAIVEECKAISVPFFRGSEGDVLDRYYQTALHSDAELIVRITSDCPLIDPGVIDRVIDEFQKHSPDYASNTIIRTLPRGLDTEVVTLRGLRQCWQEARESYERVHVTPYFYQNPGKFRLLPVIWPGDYSQHRWTVDTPEDLRFITQVYEHLGPGDSFSWTDVLSLIESHPELADINREIQQKNLHEG